MSLWQFQACMIGHAKGQGADDKGEAPSDEAFLEAASTLY
jgi:hypothetical protein